MDGGVDGGGMDGSNICQKNCKIRNSYLQILIGLSIVTLRHELVNILVSNQLEFKTWSPQIP